MRQEARDARWENLIDEANEDTGRNWQLLKAMRKRKEPNAPVNSQGKLWFKK